MATEEVLLGSPRLSFSENLNLDGDGDCERNDGFLPLEAAGSIDFNFSVIFQSSNSGSSDADELFSGGKILPFFKTTTVPPENSSGMLPRSIIDHGGTLDAISNSTAGSGGTASVHRRDISRHSIWRFGRSSSAGSVTPAAPISPIFPLHRSRSTGSFPQPSSRTPPLAAANKASSKKFAVDPNLRKTYYYSGSKRGSHRSGGGVVRITPVLNVPAPMVSRGGSGSSSSSATVSSLFSYLLCSCGGEERRDEPDSAHCNPTKRSGTSQLRGVSF